MNRWRAMGGQRTDPNALVDFYQQNRSNPQAIMDWAAQHVGPQRALEEAERFSLNMERQIADGNRNRGTNQRNGAGDTAAGVTE